MQRWKHAWIALKLIRQLRAMLRQVLLLLLLLKPHALFRLLLHVRFWTCCVQHPYAGRGKRRAWLFGPVFACFIAFIATPDFSSTAQVKAGIASLFLAPKSMPLVLVMMRWEWRDSLHFRDVHLKTRSGTYVSANTVCFKFFENTEVKMVIWVILFWNPCDDG